MIIPPRVVLAGVDFSDSSRVALTFAARLAIHARAALHVVHAEDPLLATASSAHGIDLAQETRSELEIFVKSAPPAAACAPEVHTQTGNAETVIRETANRLRADVIVLGMRGISAAEHIMFGSTTEAILRAAEVSVFAVPDGWTPPRADSQDLSGIGPVVVAVEPDPPAIAAAAAAARLAGMLHTPVEAVHVVPKVRVLNRWQNHANALAEERETAARLELEAALASIGTSGPIDLRIVTGHVAECVAKVVKTTPHRHPLLVIGRRAGATGATAYRILALAKAPVLQFGEPS